ncbi:MAG TPA: catalase-related domain-containing protein [Rhodocyclaceae bacterium]|nr:catalase-related domain-containing protein [Rhodocyclaceae bacterium]
MIGFTTPLHHRNARECLTSNIAGAMKSVGDDDKQLQLSHFTKVDPEYGAAVATKLAALS